MTSVRTRFYQWAGPGLALGALLIVVSVTWDLGIGAVYVAGVLLAVAGTAGQLLEGLGQRPSRGADAPLPRPTGAPVSGRWRSHNSPARRIPSHGTHALAQTFAIDITHEPEGSPPRRLALVWPVARRPEAYPSFGQPVLAPFDGVVVGVETSRRDHLTRLSSLGLVYLLLEGFVRGMGAPKHVLGNHLMIQATDGRVVAVLAHLRRGSVSLSAGDRVVRGQQVAECGNSGNSSDPHLHFQLMDGPDVRTARGVPFEWQLPGPDGPTGSGVPDTAALFVGCA
jgi:hypothetical protein